MFLLDTNVCIHILNDDDAAIRRRFTEVGPREIALCSVVKAELYAGARRSARVESNLQRLAIFFEPLRSLAFEDAAAEHYGVIQAHLLTVGTPIGPNDLAIAAIARAWDAALVTHYTAEFSRVPGLRFEDWQS